jgi:hypothetical protein
MSVGSAGLAAAQGSGGKGSEPHRNSGTVKIDETPLAPVGQKDIANHPHVSCEFTISFWGFDEGTHATDVGFTAQPPSGYGQAVPALLSPTVFTFTGKEPGSSLDTQKTYKLDVTGLKANPQQGFHIKVETNLLGNTELDKYKVFWYEPCGVPTTTTTSPTTDISPCGSEDQDSDEPCPTSTTSTSTSTTSTTLTPTSSTTPEEGTTTTSTTQPGATTTPTTTTPTTSTPPTTSNGSGAVTGGTTTTTTVGSAGQGPGSRSGLAFTSGPTPSGAGTDLGFFGTGNGPSDFAWILVIAGGFLLAGAGTLTLNGNRIRRWMRRA